MKKIVYSIVFIILLVSCNHNLEIPDPEINPPTDNMPTGNVVIRMGGSAGSLSFIDKDCEELADLYTILIFNEEKIFLKNWNKKTDSEHIRITLPEGTWQIVIIAGITSKQDTENIGLIGVSELDKNGFEIKSGEHTSVNVQMCAINNIIENPDIFCGKEFTLNINYRLSFKKNINDKILFPKTIQVERSNNETGDKQMLLEVKPIQQTANYSKKLKSPKYVNEETFKILRSDYFNFKFSENKNYILNIDFCGKNWVIPSHTCHTKAITDEISYKLNYIMKEGTGDIIIIW